MKISAQSIDQPLIVGLFTAVILVVGIISVKFLPVELFPEIETPYVFVTVQYPGASPSEIEFQVNKKLESELKSLSNVKKITSIAAQGAGTVIIQFSSDVDPSVSRSKVKEAVDLARPTLPSEVEEPIVQSMDFAKIPVMNVLLHGMGKSDEELKDIAEEVKKVFDTVPQVANVQVFGGLDREITFAVNPYHLWAKKVNLTQLVQFFQGGNLDTPGGKLSIGTRDYPIRVLARFVDAEDVRNTVFTYRDGKPLYLRGLGEIFEGTAEKISYARYNGSPAVSLAIIKDSKSNLLRISASINYAINKIKESGLLPEGLDLTVVGDQAEEVRIRVDELTSNAIQGIIAVFIILLIGLGPRNALIASLAIPFCMVFTMIGLLIFDETFNNLTQFGLILVVGIVVDGAIVVLENVYRHREMSKDLITAAKEGTEEVGTAVVSSVLTTMAAFAPLLFMTGIVGDFMSTIPRTVIFALTGSILFDHIVIPVLCSRFMVVRGHDEISPIVTAIRKLGRGRELFKHHPFEWLYAKYQKLIRWSIKHRGRVAVITVAVFLFGLMLMGTLKKETFPEVDIGKIWVDIELPKGTGVKHTNTIALQVENILEQYRRKPKQNSDDRISRIVKSYSSNVGSSGISVFGGGAAGSRNQGPNTARLDIDLIPLQDREIGVDDYIDSLRKELLKTCVGAKIKVSKPKGGPPTGPPVNVVISGDNIPVLKRLANKAKAIVKKIPAVLSVEDNYGIGRPEIQLPIDRLKAERHGVSVQEIQNLIFILNNGYKVSTYSYGQKELEIRLKLNEEYKKSFADLKKLTIFSQRLQRPIPLTELVDINLQSGLSFIQREDFLRSIIISGDVNRSKRTTAEVSDEVKSILSDRKVFPLPPGYNIYFRGENEDRDESFEGLKFSFLIGVMLIYFIVVIQLNSFIQPVAIMITVLLSIVGVSL
ncbi:MAG: efflux RND transporter permease subunit, partial [Spirochaetota bacterium]|nr:efflux RND transporter permease subunit [Spirochaetota bacterium]